MAFLAGYFATGSDLLTHCLAQMLWLAEFRDWEYITESGEE